MLSIIPTLSYVERSIVTGFSVRTQNSDEFNEKKAKIPRLWQQFYNSDLVRDAHVLAVYSNYDSDENSFYTLTVGIASNEAKSQLSSATIEPGNYLVFQGQGSMPAVVIEIWQQIWRYFKANNQYQRNFISDFEVYTGSDKAMVYIGIK